jgi:hypothetical protein
MVEPIKLDRSLRTLLEKFLASPHAKNEWLTTGQLSVYVRKGHHMVNRHLYLFIDLANITVIKEMRGRGLFKQTFELFKKSCGKTYQGVYVESVNNPHLANHLRELAETDSSCHWNEETQGFSWLKKEGSNEV